MALQNCLVALRPGRNHINRNLADLLDAMQVGTGLRRQRIPGLRAPKVVPLQPGMVSRMGSQRTTSSAPIGSRSMRLPSSM
jgi:hypothetical protein